MLTFIIRGQGVLARRRGYLRRSRESRENLDGFDDFSTDRISLGVISPSELASYFLNSAIFSSSQLTENSFMAIWPSALASLRVNQSGKPLGSRSVSRRAREPSADWRATAAFGEAS